MLDWTKIKFCAVDKLTGNKVGEFSDTSGITTADNNLVDYFVEIPPIYIRHNYSLIRDRFYVSFEQKRDLEPHPAFIHNRQLHSRYLAAFEGYIDADNRLRSIPGVQPTTSKTIDEFRTAAKNRTPNVGVYYGLKTGYDYGLLGLLFALKYGDLNSQAVLSAGITNLASGTGNHSQNTGHTLQLGSQSDGEVELNTLENGAVFQTGETVTHPFRFLWIENLWGNVWEFLDGFFKTADGLYFGEENDITTPSNMKEFYPREDVTTSVSGYVDKTDKRIQWGIIPDVSFGGSSTAYLSDYMWYYVGERIALSGAAWGGGSRAGLFALVLNFAPSGSVRVVGARCAFWK